ncbi:zinc finger BED domain-containing protein RICESLEEPER 1-like [Camellia sinensis]|uniref:zinc finger BED domain-containing protein RICESLEEPER 1-like n=1 Tax=Camellia sinensis TaxID=4442 RepID=UPI00103628D9|nr:zinc finger BED domain-containing protein RICESLEEPER 1-like [Camellia sinensis]
MMLSAALEFKDVFPRHQERDPSFVYVPSLEDWVKVETICQFLAIFNEVTNIISWSEYPTSNLFLAEVWRIKEILNEKSVDDNDYIKAMALKMKRKFDKYWGECNLLMAIAAVLDPRFKLMLVQFCFPEIYPEAEATRNISMVRDALYELYNEYVVIHTSSNNEQTLQQSTQEANDSSNATYGSGKALGTGRSKFESFVRKADTIQPAKSDLDIYLEESVYICNEGSNSHFDALEWWKVNNLKYRILSKMAVIYCQFQSVQWRRSRHLVLVVELLIPIEHHYQRKQSKSYYVDLTGYVHYMDSKRDQILWSHLSKRFCFLSLTSLG